jgi:hypothetical protein
MAFAPSLRVGWGGGGPCLCWQVPREASQDGKRPCCFYGGIRCASCAIKPLGVPAAVGVQCTASWTRLQPCSRGFKSCGKPSTTTCVVRSRSLHLWSALTIRESRPQVIGHADVKEAFLLALLAREHIYIEGPPGVAKTMLSEIVSSSTDLKHFFYQCHRDTRLNELVGESVIVRSTDAKGREVIEQEVVHGRMLTCELAVLDDISRAPGEALNVLLRVLNERRWGGGPRIPLMTVRRSHSPPPLEWPSCCLLARCSPFGIGPRLPAGDCYRQPDG